MLRKCLALVMLVFAVVSIAGCTSNPDDRGDVTGRDEYRRAE